jgi:choline monooxygenase
MLPAWRRCFALPSKRFPPLRGNDDRVGAFHNVCRRIAGPLAPVGERRCAGALTCRYHGWRYSLDGRLVTAGDFGPAADFNWRTMNA